MSGLPILDSKSPLPASPLTNLRALPSPILYRLLFPKTSPSVNLLNASTFLSSASGLDKGLMALQYPPKVIIPMLIALVRILSKAGKSGGLRLSVQRALIGLTESLSKLSSTVGDARTLMRIFGLVHTLAYHPSKPSLTPEYLQSLLLLLYYPLEHLVYLQGHSIIPSTLLSNQTTGILSLWSCRFWAGYVLVDLLVAYKTYQSLKVREGNLRDQRKSIGVAQVMEKQGYSLEGGEMAKAQEEALMKETEALRSAWVDWWELAGVNGYVLSNRRPESPLLFSLTDMEIELAFIGYRGYAPLTIHWSLPNGLWSNPAWTGIFGTLACFSGIRRQWRKL